ncbi:hypothetical protein D0T49_03905 [Paludibacter sp. 221]|uniref:hypothetical protein n=1 Tax=Paludibacter sp. 221 TaxID=2302939 RepID=UPI0013D66E9F|nr:hypothetical protein [Paludibacter sp. 221]NDV46185.1 hypothetical protein [Paludibacter sp. 221]
MSNPVEFKIGNVTITPRMAETLNEWYDVDSPWESFPAMAYESLSQVQDEISKLLTTCSQEEQDKFIDLIAYLLDVRNNLKQMIPNKITTFEK